MSRTFLYGVLVILVALVCTLVWAMQPKPAPQPTEADQTRMAEIQKKAMEMEKKQRQDMIKKMAEARKKQEKLIREGKVKPPTPGMQIKSNWHEDFPDGEAGFKALKKRDEELAKNPPPMPSPMAAPPNKT